MRKIWLDFRCSRRSRVLYRYPFKFTGFLFSFQIYMSHSFSRHCTSPKDFPTISVLLSLSIYRYFYRNFISGPVFFCFLLFSCWNPFLRWLRFPLSCPCAIDSPLSGILARQGLLCKCGNARVLQYKKGGSLGFSPRYIDMNNIIKT